jgi:glycosyltransferase involved in cell wall biosynthesis
VTAPLSPRVSRVLTIAPTPFFGDRGCHVRIYEEVRALKAAGLDSLIVTYAAGGDLPDIAIRRSARVPGIRPRALGPSWGRPFLDLALLREVFRAVRDFRPDVVHAHLHEGTLLAAIVRARTGLPFVADLQGSLTEELIDHRFVSRGGLLARATRAIETWLVGLPDAILVSSVAASGLVAAGHPDPSRIVSLPDGADLDLFGPRPRDPALVDQLGLRGRRVVVFLGVLTPYQGVDALLDAASLVAARLPDVRFLVMGYPNEERYRAMARDRGLEAHVTFTGRIPYAKAPDWLTLGDVAVSPKQSLTEANGKLVNYMACGLPVVATDTPVNRELLGSYGRYAPVGDTAALAARLTELLENEGLRRELGGALRARAEAEFAWPALGARLVAIYERIAAGAAPVPQAA